MFPKVTVPKTFSLKYLRRGTVLSNITKKGKVYLFIFLKFGKFFKKNLLVAALEINIILVGIYFLTVNCKNTGTRIELS